MSSFDYRAQDEGLVRTGQYQSNLTDVIYNLFGQNSAQQQNNFNAQQAQINRDFQERMSNTQWQRAVADMEAAGLNSALAYSQGGASVPSGSTASASQGGTALLSLLGGIVGSVSSLAKAAITANSAKALSGLTTVTDTFKTGKGTRTMTWKE